MAKTSKYSPYPGDTEVSVLEKGEYVLNRNAVKGIGKRKLDKWNYKDHPRYPDSQDNHRMGRAKMMAQKGGEVKKIYGSKPVELNFDDPSLARMLMSVPASQVGGEGGDRYYLGEGRIGALPELAVDRAEFDARDKMRYSPADSIPQAMVDKYFDKPSKVSGFLKRLGIKKQEGGFIDAGTSDLKQKLQKYQQAQMMGSKDLAKYAQARLYAQGGYIKGYAFGGEVDETPKPAVEILEEGDPRLAKHNLGKSEWKNPDDDILEEASDGSAESVMTDAKAYNQRLGNDPASMGIDMSKIKSNLDGEAKLSGGYKVMSHKDMKWRRKYGEPRRDTEFGDAAEVDAVDAHKGVGTGLKGALQGFGNKLGKGLYDAKDSAGHFLDQNVKIPAMNLGIAAGEKAGQAKDWIKKDWDKGADSKLAGGLGFLSMMGQEAINPGAIRQRALEDQMFANKKENPSGDKTIPEVKAIEEKAPEYVHPLDGAKEKALAMQQIGLKMPDSITGKGRLTPAQSAFEREEDQEYNDWISETGHMGIHQQEDPSDPVFDESNPYGMGSQRGGFIHGIGHYQDGGFVDPHNNSRRLMNQARRRYVRNS